MEESLPLSLERRGGRGTERGTELSILVCHIRTARRKAREVAAAEVLALLADLGAVALGGGPMSDRGGLFWIDTPEESLAVAERRLPRLGYTDAVDLLTPDDAGGAGSREVVRWRGRPFAVSPLYVEDAQAYREASPDQAEFLLAGADGVVRAVRGYRGSGGARTRRALPVCDARLLVNLAAPPAGCGRLLDPFAGAGGVVRAAVRAGLTVASTDIDPQLAAGLAGLGAEHRVADARRLPLDDASFDAVATEPPYDASADNVPAEAMAELCRVLKPAGRLAMLAADWQEEGLTRAAAGLPLAARMIRPIDRKGSPCLLACWVKEAR
ncbi:MAG: hypothetical protein BIFFINMI_01924 [Phycisphaerae bacterium]|nr:hypothetical protein [Phycisphaerae bacterium]